MNLQRFALGLAACAALTLAACAEDATSPPQTADPAADAASFAKKTVDQAALEAAGLEVTVADHFVVAFSGGLATLEDAVATLGGSVYRSHPEIGLATVLDLSDDAAAELESAPGVKAVTRDLSVQWIPEPGSLQQVEGPTAQANNKPPTDAFFYPCQWNLRQIDAPGAWNEGYYGDPDVKVAVLDTGVDPFHQDLAGKVDPVASRSLLTPGTSPCNEFLGLPDEETSLDFAYHGSFVASLITTNGVDLAGVAPAATVVAIKVLNCVGDGSFADVIAGILYAASLDDVEIINLSLGAYFPKNAAGPLIGALNKAVNYAQGVKGKLVVIASGNDGANLDKDGNFTSVPAQSGSGISIYATDVNDFLAGYSNYGRSGTWIGGPGGDGDVPPSNPFPGCVLEPDLQGLLLGVCSTTSWRFSCGNRASYLIGDGTSFAAPIAAGVAALLDGKYGGALNGNQLKTKLGRSADDLGKKGTDGMYSHGRVNAAQAVN